MKFVEPRKASIYACYTESAAVWPGEFIFPRSTLRVYWLCYSNGTDGEQIVLSKSTTRQNKNKIPRQQFQYKHSPTKVSL